MKSNEMEWNEMKWSYLFIILNLTIY